MVYGKYKQLIPVLVLTLYSISAIVSAIQGTVILAGQTYDFELTTKHYLAFASILLNIVCFFQFRRFLKYILSATVLIGAFNFITFPSLEMTWSFNIGSLEIGFQPAAFLAGLIAYLINRKKVNGYIIDQFRPSPEDAERSARTHWNESVNKFKVRYTNYSNEDLNQILVENKYVPEALEAARQLISERSKTTVD